VREQFITAARGADTCMGSIEPLAICWANFIQSFTGCWVEFICDRNQFRWQG